MSDIQPMATRPSVDGPIDTQHNQPIDTQDVKCPHTLWKQIVGIGISSVAITAFGGPFLALMGILVFADAWVAGIFKKPDSKGFFNISPMAWGVATHLLLVIALPLYLIFRNKIKTKKGSTALFIMVLVFGVLALMVAALQVLVMLKGSSPG